MKRLTRRFRFFNRLARRYRAQFVLRRLSTVLIVMAMLVPVAMPVHSSASGVAGQVREASVLAPTVESVLTALATLFNKIESGRDKSPVLPNLRAGRPQETPAVVGLELTPGEAFELPLNEQLIMMAVPVDDTGSAVQGVSAVWESSNGEVVSITGDGEATANHLGTAVLTASAGGQSATVEVTVVNVSSVLGPGEGTLPNDETASLYTVANIVGTPTGKATPTATTSTAATGGKELPGSANFSFGVRLENLPGRGLDLSLGLVYNSRLWNNSAESNGRTRLTFNVDSGWPAPGFRLGYGQLESQGTDAFTLTDSDGTRHAMRKVVEGAPGYDYEATDSSFIVYSSATKTVTYTDGTHVLYDVGGTGTLFYPTRITDRHGNYVTISYVTRFQPRISSIKDTLSRFVRFYYNSSNELTSITVPTYRNQLINGKRERTVARFYYTNIPITGLFSSTVDVTAPASAPRGIQYVYFPGTQTGYHYEYSTYGMIYKTTHLRGMTASDTAVTQEGQSAATTTYDYHGSPGGQTVQAGGLTDAPFYKKRTDHWAGQKSGPDPFYTFDVDQDNGLTTITAPDQTVTVTKSKRSHGQWDEGLIESITIKVGATVLDNTAISWEHDGHLRNPRPMRVEVTDEAQLTRATLYTYDEFNNVREVRELNFSAPGANGAELRRTVTTYRHEQETSSTQPYHLQRLVRLPTSIEVYSVNGTATTLVSKVDYSYDTVTVTPSENYRTYSDITMLDPKYNPLSPSSIFDPTLRRADLITTTSYKDISDLNNANKKMVTWQHYDVAGNVFEAKLSCCQQKTFNYSVDNQYAYLVSETRGSGAAALVRSATYDKYTGAALTETDENGQTAILEYQAATMRLSKVTDPDGSYTETIYDDTLHAEPDQDHLHSLITTNTGPADSDGGDLTSYQYFDGRGAVTRTFLDQAAEGYFTTDITYDKMGRVEQISNPYLTPYSSRSTQPINQTGKWTKRIYDNLERITKIVAPDGNSVTNENVVQITYSGIVSTVTDTAGNARRQITDALGRVVRVDEPDPATGDLGSIDSPAQPTQYWYDALDNVVKIVQGGTWQGESVQGGQTRYFMYDSVSRLIRERQVEQDTPALNNLADPLTGNSVWSCRYEYNDNDHGMLTDKYDARQIHTQYSYDTTFHRLIGIKYLGGVTTNQNEVLPPSPEVTYTYGDDAASFNKGRLIKVETAAVMTVVPNVLKTVQEYGYDLMGRVNQQTETVGSNSYKLNYSYNKLGQLRTETYPSGRVVSYDYKNGANLNGVRDSARTYLSEMTYDINGGLASEQIGSESVGLARTFDYNSRLQLSQISLEKGSSVLQRYDYKYGLIDQTSGQVNQNKNNGQIARIEGFIGGGIANPTKQWQQRLSYDSLGRLAKVAEYQGTSGSLTYNDNYTYDVYGNRYQKASQNPVGLQEDPQPYIPVEANDISTSNNRFINIGATPVTYDMAGNMIEDRKFLSMQYRYDANGRQRWAKKVNENSVFTSIYDATGQRVATQINAEGWNYLVYDIFGQLVAEYGAAVSNESGVRFIMGDHQGSTRALISTSGTVLARHDYLPFGEEVQADTGLRTTAQGYGGADQTRQRYAGMERDAGSSGLDHALWRKYDGSSGRWTNPDPYQGSMNLGNPQSFNRYAYVLNDPVNFIDPSGLDAALDQGIQAAREALQGALCRSLFHGYRGDPLQLLETYAKPQNNLLSVGQTYPVNRNGKVEKERFNDPDVGAITSFAAGHYTVNGNTFFGVNTITINTEGFYFTLKEGGIHGKVLNTLKDKGFYGLNTSQLRGAVILHELAHAAHTIPGDLKNKKQSQLNSERVRLLCFSPLNKIEPLRTSTPDTGIFLDGLGGGDLDKGGDGDDNFFDVFAWFMIHPTSTSEGTDPEGPPKSRHGHHHGPPPLLR